MGRHIFDETVDALPIHRPFTSDDTVATRTGVQGASLYLASTPSSPTSRGFFGGTDWMSRGAAKSRVIADPEVDAIVLNLNKSDVTVEPPPIVYRNYRFLNGQGQIMKAGNLENGRQGTRVASCVSPATSMNATLPADSTCRLQVRPFKDDIESPFVHGERIIRTNASAEEIAQVRGSGHVVRVELCEGGGAKIHFVWDDLGEGDLAVDFRLTFVSGPTSPSDVILTWGGTRTNRMTVPSGLTDGGYYVANLFARDAAGNETGVPMQTGGFDVVIIPDASGPSAVSGLDYIER